MVGLGGAPRGEIALSVIIPTYNHHQHLALTLGSLWAQDLDPARFEVIVVDDGSTDRTPEVCERFADRMSLSYFFQEDHGFRAAAARNVGLAAARGRTVVFLDTGVILAQNALSRHSRRFMRSGAASIRLSYGVDEYSSVRNQQVTALLQRSAEEAAARDAAPRGEREREAATWRAAFEALRGANGLLDCRHRRLRDLSHDLRGALAPWSIFWTSHVACRRDDALAIGGFDEALTSWGGEDVDFGYRLAAGGVALVAETEYDSIHLPHRKNPASRRRSSLRNLQYLEKKHNDPLFADLGRHGWSALLAPALAA
ncbi:MAG: glycosyltransferase [Pseudomonadota bacterium]